MRTLFITGASGFIGRHVLDLIDSKKYRTIYCLSRTGKISTADSNLPDNIKVIKGDLLDSTSYSEFLASSDIVIHLAALTGKAKPSEYFDINTRGTKYLVRECERLGVEKLLFVSTIAVTFPDISHYYYAQSKKMAEDIVRQSRIKYSIVRPTIVIGREGAIWLSLLKLANGPLPMVFGKGTVKIQPIYISDLARVMLCMIDKERFQNEIYDLGGPEILTFEEFIHLIHMECGGERHSLFHIPLGFVLRILGVLEKYFYNQLPMNTGQLSSFRFNSTTEANRMSSKHASSMKDAKSMIREIVYRQKKNDYMKLLTEECIVFSQFIVNEEIDEYVCKKYIDGHSLSNIALQKKNDLFNGIIVAVARLNPLLTRLADTYTSVFYRRSLLRKKLVLLLAILEIRQSYISILDTANESSKPILFLQLLQRELFFLGLLMISSIIFGPVHIFSEIVSKIQEHK